tara:strand:- start:885 stop:1151 length:267 start_codon:yes stop_codon:yes gene_type:complete
LELPGSEIRGPTIISGGSKEMFEEAPAAPAARDTLVVGSKVKAYVKSQGAMSSGALIGAVSDKVYALLDDAIGRAKANKRSTVKNTDL